MGWKFSEVFVEVEKIAQAEVELMVQTLGQVHENAAPRPYGLVY